MRQPYVAEHMAEVMARRKLALEHARVEVDAEAGRRRMQAEQRDMLSRIRDFFSLGKSN